MQTISDEYAKQNQELHATCNHYGCKSHRHLPNVFSLMVKHKCLSMLDYGCGKGALVRKFQSDLPEYRVQGYDPGHPDYLADPFPADMLVCTDVLEHIEPECLEHVLKEIRTLSRKVVFFVIALRLDSSKLLPDGSNPHKIVQSVDDWIADMCQAWGRRNFELTVHDYVHDKQITCSVKWV